MDTREELEIAHVNYDNDDDKYKVVKENDGDNECNKGKESDNERSKDNERKQNDDVVGDAEANTIVEKPVSSHKVIIPPPDILISDAAVDDVINDETSDENVNSCANTCDTDDVSEQKNDGGDESDRSNNVDEDDGNNDDNVENKSDNNSDDGETDSNNNEEKNNDVDDDSNSPNNNDNNNNNNNSNSNSNNNNNNNNHSNDNDNDNNNDNNNDINEDNILEPSKIQTFLKKHWNWTSGGTTPSTKLKRRAGKYVSNRIPDTATTSTGYSSDSCVTEKPGKHLVAGDESRVKDLRRTSSLLEQVFCPLKREGLSADLNLLPRLPRERKSTDETISPSTLSPPVVDPNNNNNCNNNNNNNNNSCNNNHNSNNPTTTSTGSPTIDSTLVTTATPTLFNFPTDDERRRVSTPEVCVHVCVRVCVSLGQILSSL